MRCRLAAFVFWATLIPACALGQKTTASPAVRTVQLQPTRPGSYSAWTRTLAGQGPARAIQPGETSVALTLPADAAEIRVLDDSAGMVAIYKVAKLKQGAPLPVSPDDFQYVRSVRVTVTGPGGKPVEKAAVTLTDELGRAQQKILSAVDGGTALFEDVAVGKARTTASAILGSARATVDAVVAPARGGAPNEIAVAMSGDIPVLSATPAPTAAPVTVIERAEPQSSAVAGWIGLAILVGLGYLGVRAARSRGLTVADTLQKIGVELPDAAPGSAVPTAKPIAAPLPPLPSLADLPTAHEVPLVSTPSPQAVTGPRLTGLEGPATGEVFALTADTAFTIGREIGNDLTLTQDSSVSRRHARLESGVNGWRVVDEGSSNGTFVNGLRIQGAQTLSIGDDIQIGATRLRFEA
jgi:hypothetical protein